MKEYVLKIWRWEPLRRAITLYVVMRVGLSVWTVLVLAVSPSVVLGDGLEGLLLEPWRRFDTVHYIKLAISGYEPGSLRTVFLPLYPFLIRVVGGVLAEEHLLAALFVSNLCAIGYLTVFYVLAEGECGRKVAQRAQIYAMLYPWAFFLLAGYTEPLSLFLITLAFLMIQRGRGWAAGLFGALAALTRLQGAVLVIPLLFEALRRRKFRLWPLGVDLVWPMLPPLASACFLLGRALAGIEPISEVFAVFWGHALAFPWMGMMVNVRNMTLGVAHPTDYLDFLAAWFFIVLAVIAWRRLRPSYALYVTVALLFNISHLRNPHPMCSVGRHMTELFPVFFILGQWGSSSPWLNRLILYLSIALFLYLSGQFVLGGWVG